jgi:RNA recognition motif-containing protein
MDKYTIWVGNLNYDTRTRDLERLFDEAGRIRRVFHPNGKGYAFIEFERYYSCCSGPLCVRTRE